MIYTPREDSYLLEKNVKKSAKGKKVLDMGSGSGILAEAALENGAKDVLAVDIDSNAVKLLKEKGISAVCSDLFSSVKGKFDLIVFNPPYLPRDKREDLESSKATCGGEKGDEIILRFLERVDKYLKKDGEILIVVSSLTPRKRILEVLERKNFKLDIIDEKKLFMERLEIWKINKNL